MGRVNATDRRSLATIVSPVLDSPVGLDQRLSLTAPDTC